MEWKRVFSSQAPVRVVRLAPALLLVLVAAPTVLAANGGNAVGATAGRFTVGVGDIWHVYVPAAATLHATLTWVDSPGGADYDMTLWSPGADQDGVLAQSEMLASSWTRANEPGESFSYAAAPAGPPYVLTVEAASAKLETYYLDVTGASALVHTCHPYSPPGTCLWGYSGVKR